MDTADVIVVGLGAMGAAASWRLAARGLRVLGLDQFALGHDRGSSHGQTRIIRQAYYEHPAYVPLVRRAAEGWHELEQLQGIHLLTACPCLTIGPASGELVAGVRRSAAEHQLPVEQLSADEIQRRYPAFDLSEAGEVVGVVEHTAGFLYVERGVQALADEARRHGAQLREVEEVLGWECEGSGFAVRTSVGRYTADRLVVTVGAWAARFLGPAGRTLTVMRQVALWHESAHPERFRRDRFPLFIQHTPEGYFYGIPAIDRRGVKVARHYGAPELPGPEGIDRTVTAEDRAVVAEYLRRYLPAAGACTAGSVCLYTLTPDRHFLIDRPPGSEKLVIAAGFSGHGFKFAPVIGEIVADLTIAGQTAWPIDLFRLNRFATSL